MPQPFGLTQHDFYTQLLQTLGSLEESIAVYEKLHQERVSDPHPVPTPRALMGTTG